jgi:hypothetical protein
MLLKGCSRCWMPCFGQSARNGGVRPVPFATAIDVNAQNLDTSKLTGMSSCISASTLLSEAYAAKSIYKGISLVSRVSAWSRQT